LGEPLPRAAASANGPRTLSVPRKIVYAAGDHTVNLSLSALALFYLFFLTEVAGLRPALAGAVPLVGRVVDACFDPVMGRISDQTRTRWGRRRPFFLLGALPFGLTFAWMWSEAPFASQGAIFAWYASAYLLHCLIMSVLSVPYLALLPEMARGYDERTSLNTFRSAAAVMGTLVVAGTLRPLAEAFGGGSGGFARAGALLAVWVALPWFFVYRVTFERNDAPQAAETPFLGAVRSLARHGSYRVLCALFLCARAAVDIVGAMFLYFFASWLARPDDFEPALLGMLVCVVASLPFWLNAATRTDKRTLFVIGCVWWIGIQCVLFLATPEWPRWTMFVIAAVAGVGYAVADLMPWSMLGDVIDEDELASGERREGLYNGLFTFLRKLGGAAGVFLAGVILDLAGFVKGAPEQGPTALLAVRALTALVPACLLAIAAFIALRYSLGRARHVEIRAALDARARGA
jgi:sugar (glycoside-pentoside-hexuronide) transporter